MPILTCEDANYGGPIPDDEIFRAKVTAVKEEKKPYKDDDGNEVVKMAFTFVLEAADDPDKVVWDGQRIWGETGNKFVNHPNCKLYAWAQEILGSEIPVGFVLDTDTLVGNHVRVVVGSKTWEDKAGVQQTRNFVKDVIRAGSLASSYAAPSAEEEPF